MKLEQQVVSLELSKRLKELGLKHESLYMWALDKSGYCMEVRLKRKISFERSEFVYSAFTVAELGEMLPMFVKTDGKENYLSTGVISENKRDKTNRKYFVRIENIGFNGLKTANTEADARAKMLIFLLENNFITL